MNQKKNMLLQDLTHRHHGSVSYTHLKDGVNIEYRFNKNGDVIYSSQYNVILDKKKGLNEVEMSYYAGTDGVDVPEYNIYGK